MKKQDQHDQHNKQAQTPQTVRTGTGKAIVQDTLQQAQRQRDVEAAKVM